MDKGNAEQYNRIITLAILSGIFVGLRTFFTTFLGPMVIDIRNLPPMLLAWFAKYIVCNRLIIFLHFHHWTYKSIVCTVYPKKYAHGFCFVVVIHWLILPYPSGLLHWHCGNLTIAPVPAKQPWWIWINTSCEFIMNDCITRTKQSTTKPCAYFLGYTVYQIHDRHVALVFKPKH